MGLGEQVLRSADRRQDSLLRDDPDGTDLPFHAAAVHG
jgi:hypothetical protein